MSITALNICTDALVVIGEVAQGQSISNEDGQFVLTRLNGMLDSLSQEEAYIFTRTITPYALTGNKGTYAIGPTASAPFNTARPTKIDFAQILLGVGGNPGVSINNLSIIDVLRYQAFSDKTTSGQVPEFLYWDAAMPNGNLYLYPVPSCVVPTQLELTVWQQLQQFASLTTVFAMPPGYYEAIVLALAVAISPGYNKPVDPTTAGRAATCTQRIKEINRLILQPGMPPASVMPQGQTPQAQQQAQIQAALQ